jgi:hypothetical protein
VKTTVRLTPPILRELRMALLLHGTLSTEMTLVEERHANGDVVVRLAGLPSAQVQQVRTKLRAYGAEEVETILGAYNVRRGGAT